MHKRKHTSVMLVAWIDQYRLRCATNCTDSARRAFEPVTPVMPEEITSVTGSIF